MLNSSGRVPGQGFLLRLTLGKRALESRHTHEITARALVETVALSFMSNCLR